MQLLKRIGNKSIKHLRLLTYVRIKNIAISSSKDELELAFFTDH